MTGRGWKREGQRSYFAKALVELGKENPNVVVCGADTTESLKTALFGKQFPDRLFNLGIAEQNMIGVSAGLALSGKIPFACTYAVFGTAQVYNVIRQAIAYPALNVKIFCSHAGISVGPDGATHQINEDLAIMRALPNMTVLVPADGPETFKATKAAAAWDGPVYCRFSRADVPTVTSPDSPFEIGRATVLRDGSDVALVGTGLMVAKCLEAADMLAPEGIDARVINVSSLKPLDLYTVKKGARECGAMVTAEEHTILGGLGAAVAQALVEDHAVPMRILGIADIFGESGESDVLLEKYGLTAENITRAAKDVLQRQRVKP
jgi:transketolase